MAIRAWPVCFGSQSALVPSSCFGLPVSPLLAGRNSGFVQPGCFRPQGSKIKMRMRTEMKDTSDRIIRITEELRALAVQLQWSTFQKSSRDDKTKILNGLLNS